MVTPLTRVRSYRKRGGTTVRAHTRNRAVSKATSTRHKAVTKPGKYGTLYLYEYEYTDRNDPAFGVESARVWRYDPTHLFDAFNESNGDDSFEILRYANVQEGVIKARWNWRKA